MCTTSMIMDTYRPQVDRYFSSPPSLVPDRAQEILEEIRSFRRLYEAAKEFDALSGQPDCEDPEKAMLLQRVDELERRLKALEAKE